MRTSPTHVICWITMLLCLTSVFLLGYLCITYVLQGTGLNPWIGVPAIVLMLALGQLAAVLADRTE